MSAAAPRRVGQAARSAARGTSSPARMVPARAAAQYLIASGVSMIIPVLTLPVLTRRLRPEDFGVIALGVVVGSLFKGLANAGLSTALERNYFEYESDRIRLAQVIHTSLTAVALGALAWGALFYAIRTPLSNVVFGTTAWGPLIVAVCADSVLGVLQLMQLTYFRNAGRARAYVMVSVGSRVLEAALSLGLVFGGFGVWGVVVGQLIGKLLMVTGCWVSLAAELPFGLSWALARELFGIGLPLMPRVFIGVANTGLNRQMLRWMSSLAQVGMLGLADTIGQAVFALLTSIEHVYIPQVYRVMFQNREDGGAEIGRFLSPYLYVSLLVPLLVALFIEEALRVIATPAYFEVKYLAAILATYYGQMVFGKLIGAQVIYAKRTWYSSAFATAKCGLQLVFAVWWIPRFGALGAAWAIFASGSLVDLVAFIVAQRLFPIAYEARRCLTWLGLLYAAMGWSLLPGVIPLPYAVWLAGKLLLAGAFIGLGRRWWPKAWAELVDWVNTLQQRVVLSQARGVSQ